ncbi:family 16 glycoside hydrolase [Chloroflexus sp. Y-396-1]|uniref:family 16 glycoside hydrolase n=1 Tax=Chloroflexus sp. Y-396-1 TaxID=867845 RepID=UPI00048C5FCA|nr:family 16 glycoside hydrolase [Chloroflexus sp. Y-396-1]
MKRLSWSGNGQSMTEITILLGLVAAVAIAGLTLTGEGTRDALCRAASAFGSNCGDLLRDSFAHLDNWTIQHGRWQIRDGRLCIEGAGRIYHPLDRSDYIIDIHLARMTRGNGYGIFFRDSGGSAFNGYTFQYDPGYGRGAFIFRKWINGRELSVPIARVDAPAGYDWYGSDRKVRVEVRDDTFTAFIDGQPVVQARDNTFTRGGIGFRSWDATSVCFDDLNVRRP